MVLMDGEDGQLAAICVHYGFVRVNVSVVVGVYFVANIGVRGGVAPGLHPRRNGVGSKDTRQVIAPFITAVLSLSSQLNHKFSFSNYNFTTGSKPVIESPFRAPGECVICDSST